MTGENTLDQRWGILMGINTVVRPLEVMNVTTNFHGFSSNWPEQVLNRLVKMKSSSLKTYLILHHKRQPLGCAEG